MERVLACEAPPALNRAAEKEKGCQHIVVEGRKEIIHVGEGIERGFGERAHWPVSSLSSPGRGVMRGKRVERIN